MAGYPPAGNNEYWTSNPPNPQQQQQQQHHHQQQQTHHQSNQQSYNFDMPESFGHELNFQTFDPNQSGSPTTGFVAGSYYDPNASYTGDIYTPSIIDKTTYAAGNGDFDDEPPLLEELGINPSHILQKTLSVLNPFRTTDQSILQDTDMAGPLVFVLTLGGFLLLSGKVTFSYIYGIGVMGCLAFYGLLSLMATKGTVTLGAVISVLGYCILPMVVLSGVNVLITIQGTLGLIFAGICILWCAMSASKLFVTAYSMDHQQILVAYPCALLYGVFALITIF